MYLVERRDVREILNLPLNTPYFELVDETVSSHEIEAQVLEHLFVGCSTEGKDVEGPVVDALTVKQIR